MSGNNIDILTLVILIREGKKEGFDCLYKNYAGSLYGIIYRVAGDRSAAEKLLETTFVTICRDIDEYDTAAPFFSWVVKKAISVSKLYTRKDIKVQNSNVIDLVMCGARTYEQAANEMNIPVASVKTNVRNTLKSYRKTTVQ